MEQQTRAAAVAVVETAALQTGREARAEAASSVSAIPERQSDPLLAQQTQQHNPAVSPSIPS
jgi:hypothetical protein